MQDSVHIESIQKVEILLVELPRLRTITQNELNEFLSDVRSTWDWLQSKLKLAKQRVEAAHREVEAASSRLRSLSQSEPGNNSAIANAEFPLQRAREKLAKAERVFTNVRRVVNEASNAISALNPIVQTLRELVEFKIPISIAWLQNKLTEIKQYAYTTT